MTDTILVHPVQNHNRFPERRRFVPVAVTLRAYEVYKKLYGEQVAMIEGECRGGFGVGELVAFLYARTFPESEWRQRFVEALKGMDL